MANLVVAGGTDAESSNGGHGIPRRPSLDTVALWAAQGWAQRGTCARRLAGCVLLDVDGFQIGAGYNGPPSMVPHCRNTQDAKQWHACPGASLPTGTGLQVCEAIHAEANALIRCSDHRRIFSVYVTCSPCIDCVKLISNTYAHRIVFVERYAHEAAAKAYWEKTRPLPGSWVHLPQAKLEFPHVQR